MSTKHQLTISDGPSVDTLLDSFKYAFCAQKITVQFRVGRIGQGSTLVDAIVTGIRYESGQPGMFNLEVDIVGGGRGLLKGFYNAKNREGIFDRVS